MESPKKIALENAEILCVGSELLLGNIINSNAKWLAEQLAAIGVSHFRQTVSGDNLNRLSEILLEASKRCRFLIITGGLGPTEDDLTTEAISKAFNTSLELQEGLWREIQKKYKRGNSSIPLNNKKQALIPTGAKIIPNPKGTAPGILWEAKPGFTLITFPGVPEEMKAMWGETVCPWFKENRFSSEIFQSKVMHFSGITESQLAENLHDLINNKNPTLALYAKLGEIKLRLTARGSTSTDALRLIKPLEEEINNRLGMTCYGFDEESLSSVVIKLLNECNETISVAESCTGGGLGASFTSIPGASKVFHGGLIAYQDSIKKTLLDIPEKLLADYGAVSKEVVLSMAENVRKKFGTDWSIAISGIAGPHGGTKSKPIGLVHFGINGPNHREAFHQFFGVHLGREAIQRLSISYCLNKLRLILLSKS